MKKPVRNLTLKSLRQISVSTLALFVLVAVSATASADEADAKRILKAMSDYLAAQTAISFTYDSTLEVVTTDDQILALASSGKVKLSRPDKINATRSGGFVDVEMNFDGTTLTIVGKNLNLYTQVEEPGSIDNLVEVLRNKYQRPLPAADLLTTDAYDALMASVVDIKDLGSGVIGGVECDSLAFRKEDVDFQIWIAQGDEPRPCRYVITSKLVTNAPQYSIQITDWATGDAVGAKDYSFQNTTGAEKVALEDLKGAGDLPSNFTPATGESE